MLMRKMRKRSGAPGDRTVWVSSAYATRAATSSSAPRISQRKLRWLSCWNSRRALASSGSRMYSPTKKRKRTISVIFTLRGSHRRLTLGGGAGG